MTNAEIAQITSWKMKASAFAKMKITYTKERELALRAIEGITFPLHQAIRKSADELKQMFIQKVIRAVGSALNTDKYDSMIAGMQL